MGKNILLLSDTHGCWDEFVSSNCSSADEVWHAGDVGNKEWINNFSSQFPGKPLRGVYGNIDDTAVRAVLPEQLVFESEGLQVAMLHIGGNMQRLSEKARMLVERVKPSVFICGHSHILQVKWVGSTNKFLFVNPGAAGIHGFHKKRTLLAFEIEKGRMENMRVIERNR